MAIFGIFEANLGVNFKKNASVGSPEPRSARDSKKSRMTALYFRRGLVGLPGGSILA